ncbi:MAG: hypothetical protein E7614_02160 [Ruminococcaceae bacterium]|nr:hypothetical protein [Oscillospiraceae bacterium]
MIITFCGHSHYKGNAEDMKKILDFLEEKVGDSKAEMYLGEYGGFDEFAYECCKKYKENHPAVSLIFVTPYITPEYQNNHLSYQKDRFDSILYPEIEDKPLRFAISYRNKYMVEQADYVIACIDHKTGGAYQAYVHAKRRKKHIFSIGKIL